MPTVYRVPKNRFEDMASRLLNMLCGREHRKLVLIKPNICGFYPPTLNVLKAVTRYFVDLTDQVVIGETKSTMYDPEERFRSLGIYEALRDLGNKVKVKDLMEYEIINVKVPNARAVGRIPIPRPVIEADLIVNLARAGSHPSTRITAALKNLFGLVAEKYKYVKYHIRGINGVIADVVKVVKPDANLVEVKEYVLASRDPLAVDIVAAQMLGLDPLGIRHFRLVAEDRGSRLENVIKETRIMDLE